MGGIDLFLILDLRINIIDKSCQFTVHTYLFKKLIFYGIKFTYTRKTEDKTRHVANVFAVKRDPINNSVTKFHQKLFLSNYVQLGLSLDLFILD